MRGDPIASDGGRKGDEHGKADGTGLGGGGQEAGGVAPHMRLRSLLPHVPYVSPPSTFSHEFLKVVWADLYRLLPLMLQLLFSVLQEQFD